MDRDRKDAQAATERPTTDEVTDWRECTGNPNWPLPPDAEPASEAPAVPENAGVDQGATASEATATEKGTAGPRLPRFTARGSSTRDVVLTLDGMPLRGVQRFAVVMDAADVIPTVVLTLSAHVDLDANVRALFDAPEPLAFDPSKFRVGTLEEARAKGIIVHEGGANWTTLQEFGRPDIVVSPTNAVPDGKRLAERYIALPREVRWGLLERLGLFPATTLAAYVDDEIVAATVDGRAYNRASLAGKLAEFEEAIAQAERVANRDDPGAKKVWHYVAHVACPKCHAKDAVQVREVNDHGDEHRLCSGCGHEWYVDGPDA